VSQRFDRLLKRHDLPPIRFTTFDTDRQRSR
jgi:hypothetical protein